MDSRERAAITRTLQAIYREMGRAGEAAVQRFAPGGRVPTFRGGTGTAQGAEPPLGNPASDGQVLSSTTAGGRSWVTPPGLSAEQVDDRVAALLVAGPNVTLDYNDAANTLTVTAKRYSLLTNGDAGAPELVYADGDVILVED